MGLSKKLLSKDEVVVRHMHTHIKVLLWRIVALVLLLVAAIVGSVFVPDLDCLCHYCGSAICRAVGQVDGRDLYGDDEADHHALGHFPAHGARLASQSYLGHSDGEGSE